MLKAAFFRCRDLEQVRCTNEIREQVQATLLRVGESMTSATGRDERVRWIALTLGFWCLNVAGLSFRISSYSPVPCDTTRHDKMGWGPGPGPGLGLGLGLTVVLSRSLSTWS